MLQETIRQIIENKLNDNTDNKKFIVGSYAEYGDDKKDFVYNVKTGYNLIETNYIPCMISFSADYQPLPDQINGSATIGAQFLLFGEKQADFETDLAALNEVVPKMVGNHQTFTEGTDTFNSVWNMDAFMPAGIVGPVNGDYYTQINTTFYVDFSDTNEYGNAYTISLTGSDNVEHYITVFDGNETRDNDEDIPHVRGGEEGRGGVEESRWSAQIITYLDDFTVNFVSFIGGENYDWETIYQYKEYHNGSIISQFPIMVKSASKPFVLGEKIALTLELIKSDQPLVLV